MLGEVAIKTIPIKQKHAAFTLAEVLITLGIIGVVAALTLPMLVQNYKKTETVSRLKKFYTTMSQAIVMSELENGSANDWEIIDNEDSDGKPIDGDINRAATLVFFNKYLAKYLKYSEVLQDSGLRDTSQDTSEAARYILVKMADGSYIYMKTGYCIDMRLDIDGSRGQNQFGKDRFSFLICNSKHKKNTCNNKNFCLFGESSFYETRELLHQACINNAGLCGALILKDGWEIKPDYPFKL